MGLWMKEETHGKGKSMSITNKDKIPDPAVGRGAGMYVNILLLTQLRG